MKPKAAAQWLEAYAWLERQKGAPAVLRKVAGEKRTAALRLARPYKPSVPKVADLRSRKQEMRDACEALCKAIVFGRDCDDPVFKLGRCITCPYHGKLQWGHFIPQNESEWLRYDPRNTAGQCVDCNAFHQGRQVAFGVVLDQRHKNPDFAANLIIEAHEMRNWRPTLTNLEAVRDWLRAMVDQGKWIERKKE